MKRLATVSWIVLAPSLVFAETPAHHPVSPYAGEQTRDIKSLSADDIAELNRGGGWGLAKAAELNGVPGPAHLLELKDDIPLSDQQVVQIEAAFADMQEKAIAAGARLIDRESVLEAAFRDRSVTEESLRRMLEDIGESRTALRYIHLAAHLTTLSLLTEAQIARYNQLRGYDQDPCASVPEGHDADMWRRHNNCG